jgi:hypothetical protein
MDKADSLLLPSRLVIDRVHRDTNTHSIEDHARDAHVSLQDRVRRYQCMALRPFLSRTDLASENPGLVRIHLVSCRLSPMRFPWSKPSIPEAHSSLCTPSQLLHPTHPPFLYSSTLIRAPIAHGTPAPHATSLPPWRYPARLCTPAVRPLHAHQRPRGRAMPY